MSWAYPGVAPELGMSPQPITTRFGLDVGALLATAIWQPARKFIFGFTAISIDHRKKWQRVHKVGACISRIGFPAVRGDPHQLKPEGFKLPTQQASRTNSNVG